MLATDKALPRFLIGWGCFFCPEWTLRGAGDAFVVSAHTHTFFFIVAWARTGSEKGVLPPHKAEWGRVSHFSKYTSVSHWITAARGEVALLSWWFFTLASELKCLFYFEWMPLCTAAMRWVFFTLTSWQAWGLPRHWLLSENLKQLGGNVSKW